MKKFTKNISIILTICMVIATITACSPQASNDPGNNEAKPKETKQYTMGTYSPTGGYMLLASGIAKATNENVPGVNLTPVPSPRGSVENVETVESGEREFGLASSNVIVDGITPREPFTSATKNVYGWFNAHYGVTWSVATKSSGITSFKEMEGKKVAIGAPGSNDEYLAEKIFLPEAGVDVSKVKIERITVSEAVNLMKDGHLDALIFTGAPKYATMAELASARETVFVPMEQSAIAKIIEKYPEFIIKNIAKDDIPNLIIDKEYPAIAMNHIAIINKNIPDDEAYEMTKAVFENLSILHEIKEEFKVITLEKAIESMPIEIHPGALKYFNEMGIKK